LGVKIRSHLNTESSEDLYEIVSQHADLLNQPWRYQGHYMEKMTDKIGMVSLRFVYMTMLVGISLMVGIPDAVVCSYVIDSLLYYTIFLICPLFYCLCFW